LSAEQWNAQVNALLNSNFEVLANLKLVDISKSNIPRGAEENISTLQPNIVPVLRRCLAAIWILGGGSTPIGEGTRVMTTLPGEENNPSAERVAGTVMRLETSRFRAGLMLPTPNETGVRKKDKSKRIFFPAESGPFILLFH
jgi:hypothetical protein